MITLLPLLATVWAWMSPEAYARGSDLIAIVRVGTVHENKTPEGILVRSAVADVEQLIYFRFTPDGKLPQKIIIYQVDPNGQLERGSAYGAPKLNEGRCFAMLKMQGTYKFVPYDRLSLQPIEDGKIVWPTTKFRTGQMPAEQIIEQLQKLLPE